MKRTTLILIGALLLVLVAPAGAVTAVRVTVASTAGGTLVYTASEGGSTVLIRNACASASVYLGASGVTTSTGFEVLAGDAVSLPVAALDTVYGIVASSTCVVHTLETRR